MGLLKSESHGLCNFARLQQQFPALSGVAKHPRTRTQVASIKMMVPEDAGATHVAAPLRQFPLPRVMSQNLWKDGLTSPTLSAEALLETCAGCVEDGLSTKSPYESVRSYLWSATSSS